MSEMLRSLFYNFYLLNCSLQFAKRLKLGIDIDHLFQLNNYTYQFKKAMMETGPHHIA
jgi:hypothetical protein